ncbi:DNA-3-methyladenine glycosylase I [Limosilactobacillus mucosae]|jgi:DNA-3-methyladenine glycosylase I|uniref:DNA-3-methyladenine glycosylase I n=1 Tax=Limosilactobacillus mucosae TaxID=97478 RepID=UPI003994C135
MPNNALKTARPRCSWVNLQNPLYVKYHDREWGRPVHDDHKLFEMLLLESFQAGLSWETVLNKREAFKQAFAEFDVAKVANFNDEDCQRLQQNPGIIRHRLKIRAAVSNAQVFMAIQQEWGTFSKYLWHWTDGKTIQEIGATKSKLSDDIAKDLKKRGMKFVGTTTIYAYLQAVGVINSHEDSCWLG